jgi:hypothetical protein
MAAMKFNFTIRDLLWMLALVAVCLGWWLDRDVIRQERRELEAMQAKFKREANFYLNLYRGPSPVEAPDN